MNSNRSPEETSSNDIAASTSISSSTRRTKSEFPIKLYAMLELAELLFKFSRAVRWLPHGRAFRILNKTKFLKEVVPVFFNQTKIRSFNRQLHLWGFRRIGRGPDQVWYHDNFLRGAPESMQNMIRTKIKGNGAVDSSDDVRAPNFDNLPPLPVRDKLPSDVLEVMEKAFLKLQSFLGVATPTYTNGTTNDHLLLLPAPRTETPCDFNVDYNQDPLQLPLPPHPHFSRTVSCESHWHRPSVQQDDYTESPTYTNQSSDQEMYQPFCVDLPFRTHSMRRVDVDDLFLSPVVSSNNDFEPLPFRDDNELCDDFANFIQDAIHHVEGCKAQGPANGEL